MNQDPIIVAVIKAIFSGVKDLILATAALATIWIQAQTSGKLDTAAAKTETVESKLDATTAKHERTLAEIAAAADASAKSWLAYKTKDPEDMDVADKALRAAERQPK
jgi:hypothetical protein